MKKYRYRKRKRLFANFNKRQGLIIIFILSLITITIRACTEVNKSITESDGFIFDDTYTVKVMDSKTDEVILMPLDEYIYHVTAAEMPASYSMEALKSQAIAARTYTVYHMRGIMGESALSCSKGSCDVCTDSTCCQSWKSDDELKERWQENYKSYSYKVYSAVKSTQGQIIVYDGKPIEAMYHAASGGRTEDSENVYSYKPYLRGVDSPGEENTDFSCSTKFSYDEVIDILKDKLDRTVSKKDIQNSFEVLSRFDSGRVDSATLCGKKYTGREIRKIFSLKSTNFYIKKTQSYVIIDTVGYGHGVGMSQAGADARAKSGMTYDEILTYYYTDTDIIQIGELKL